MKFYQACFGKPNNVNWSLYNTSDDIPADMSSFYERAENRNTPQNLNNEDMVDANGNPICITEILSQDGVVALSKIQYGSKDNLGRAAMIAHGYLFSIEDSVLNEPNNILSIAESNFKFDVEETKVVPSELLYSQQFTLREAFEQSGIDTDKLINLVSCIYVSLTSATDFPIYVCSPRAKEVMMPLMYCVYKLLPYSLRYSISFSNANNLAKAQFKSLMFVEKKFDGSYSFDLDSGETNIDLSELDTYKDKYPFLNKLKEVGTKEFQTYCDTLQSELNNMQMPHSIDYNMLKLADIFTRDISYVTSMNDQELTRFLLEVMGSAPVQNNYVDTKLSAYLSEFVSRGIAPNEAFMRRVQVRNEKTPCKEFVTLYKQLQMKCLAEQGDAAVIAFLSEQYRINKDRFVDWRQYILNLQGGNLLIEKYYSQSIGHTRSYEELVNVYKECPKEARGALLTKMVDEQCIAILRIQLNEKDSIDGAFTKTLDTYKGIFNALHPEDNQKFYEIFEQECVRYWNNFDLSKFEFSEVKIANFKSLDTEKSSMYRFIKLLIEIYDAFEGNSKYSHDLIELAEKAIQALNNFDRLTEQQWKIIIPQIQNYLVKKLQRYKGDHFWFWYQLANFKSEKNPYINLFSWNLEVLVNEHAFARSITFDQLSKKQIDRLIEDLAGDDEYYGYLDSGDFEKNSEEYKLLKKRLGILNDFSKSIEKQARAKAKDEAKSELKAMKEEKERQKAEMKEHQKEAVPHKKTAVRTIENKPRSHKEIDVPEKKGFLSSIFGGNSKKK